MLRDWIVAETAVFNTEGLLGWRSRSIDSQRDIPCLLPGTVALSGGPFIIYSEQILQHEISVVLRNHRWGDTVRVLPAIPSANVRSGRRSGERNNDKGVKEESW